MEQDAGTPGEQRAPFEWGAALPEAHGWTSAARDALLADLAGRGTKALLVIRRDQIIGEWYAPEWHRGRPHYSASLAKALVGGTSLLLALGDGRLRPDDRAATFVPAWRSDPQRSQITIRHLATHSSGLDDAEHDVDPADPGRGWMDAFWRRDPDPFSVSRDRTPMVFAPGAGYRYSNPGMAMLAYCATAALRGAPRADLRTLLAERVYGPIGLRDGDWSIGYRTPYAVAGLTLWANWGGGAFTARAAARIGRLMLRRGDWQGTDLLDPHWVAQALTHTGSPLPRRDGAEPAPASGLCWYVNQDGVWPDVPRDAFAGAGAGHQLLLVVPGLQLIVVRFGEHLGPDRRAGFWRDAYQHVFAPVLRALRP